MSVQDVDHKVKLAGNLLQGWVRHPQKALAIPLLGLQEKHTTPLFGNASVNWINGAMPASTVHRRQVVSNTTPGLSEKTIQETEKNTTRIASAVQYGKRCTDVEKGVSASTDKLSTPVEHVMCGHDTSTLQFDPPLLPSLKLAIILTFTFPFLLFTWNAFVMMAMPHEIAAYSMLYISTLLTYSRIYRWANKQKHVALWRMALLSWVLAHSAAITTILAAASSASAMAAHFIASVSTCCATLSTASLLLAASLGPKAGKMQRATATVTMFVIPVLLFLVYSVPVKQANIEDQHERNFVSELSVVAIVFFCNLGLFVS